MKIEDLFQSEGVAVGGKVSPVARGVADSESDSDDRRKDESYVPGSSVKGGQKKRSVPKRHVESKEEKAEKALLKDLENLGENDMEQFARCHVPKKNEGETAEMMNTEDVEALGLDKEDVQPIIENMMTTTKLIRSGTVSNTKSKGDPDPEFGKKYYDRFGYPLARQFQEAGNGAKGFDTLFKQNLFRWIVKTASKPSSGRMFDSQHELKTHIASREGLDREGVMAGDVFELHIFCGNEEDWKATDELWKKWIEWAKDEDKDWSEHEEDEWEDCLRAHFQEKEMNGRHGMKRMFVPWIGVKKSQLEGDGKRDLGNGVFPLRTSRKGEALFTYHGESLFKSLMKKHGKEWSIPKWSGHPCDSLMKAAIPEGCDEYMMSVKNPDGRSECRYASGIVINAGGASRSSMMVGSHMINDSVTANKKNLHVDIFGTLYVIASKVVAGRDEYQFQCNQKLKTVNKSNKRNRDSTGSDSIKAKRSRGPTEANIEKDASTVSSVKSTVAFHMGGDTVMEHGVKAESRWIKVIFKALKSFKSKLSPSSVISVRCGNDKVPLSCKTQVGDSPQTDVWFVDEDVEMDVTGSGERRLVLVKNPDADCGVKSFDFLLPGGSKVVDFHEKCFELLADPLGADGSVNDYCLLPVVKEGSRLDVSAAWEESQAKTLDELREDENKRWLRLELKKLASDVDSIGSFDSIDDDDEE